MELRMSLPNKPARFWLPLLAAGFAPLVFAQLGLNLYIANEAQLIGADKELLRYLCGALGCWVLVFGLLRWGGSVGKCFWAASTACACFFLLRELAFPLALGPLDGDSRYPHLASSYRTIEMAALFGAFLGFLCTPQRITAPLAGAAGLVFGLFCLGSIFQHPASFGLASSNELAWVRAGVPLSIPGQRASQPDVYQILFDEYQIVEHQFVRRERGIAPYDDFMCFENNIGNYNHTWLSLPSLLNGAEYPPDMDIRQWFESYNRQGLLKSLKENGYNIRVFGHHDSWWKSPLTDYSRCTNEIAQEWLKGNTGNEFLSLVGMRALPSRYGKKLHPSKRQPSEPGTVPQRGDYAFYCAVKFRELVRGIKATPAGGNYTFAHLILPHGPHVLDREGNHVGEGNSSRLGQVYFVDKLVSELIAELKRLGRYEQSLIVLHADTGSYYATDVKQQAVVKGALSRVRPPEWLDDAVKRDGSLWPLSTVQARANALLLIKPPYHQGYETVATPSQLLDLPPTILGAVGLQEASRDYRQGCDLLNDPPGPQRVRKTYVYGARIGGDPKPHMQEVIIREGRLERGKVIPFTGMPF